MTLTAWKRLPMAAVLIGGGLMMGLLACEPAERRERVGEEETEVFEGEPIREGAHEMGEGARELGQETSEGARDLADEVGDGARDIERDID